MGVVGYQGEFDGLLLLLNVNPNEWYPMLRYHV